jgi:hypothetical protein
VGNVEGHALLTDCWAGGATDSSNWQHICCYMFIHQSSGSSPPSTPTPTCPSERLRYPGCGCALNSTRLLQWLRGFDCLTQLDVLVQVSPESFVVRGCPLALPHSTTFGQYIFSAMPYQVPVGCSRQLMPCGCHEVVWLHSSLCH